VIYEKKSSFNAVVQEALLFSMESAIQNFIVHCEFGLTDFISSSEQ
jgi:hypothetical protein